MKSASKILIVDDVSDNLRLLSTTLTQQGYQVRCAKSGAIALMGANNDLPDLILLDINMPEMNGYQVCQKFKADQKTADIPIIFLTAAFKTEVFQQKGYEVGAADYLLKPIDDNQLINISSNSILDYSFPGWLAEQMTAACIDGSRVILQVSAHTAQANLRPVQRLIKELKPLGCKLSVCRFDAERRTLQLLEHLDTSYIKLNASLTDDLISNTKNQEAIRKVVDVAEKNGILVIADEVADTSSLAVLWQCGVKLIAGAFLSESSQVIAQ